MIQIASRNFDVLDLKAPALDVDNKHHLGLGHFIGKHPAFAQTSLMYGHHDTLGSLMILMEQALQYVHDEIHGSEVVV